MDRRNWTGRDLEQEDGAWGGKKSEEGKNKNFIY